MCEQKRVVIQNRGAERGREDPPPYINDMSTVDDDAQADVPVRVACNKP